MPSIEPIPVTGGGWPYLPDNAPIADQPAYTQMLAAALSGMTPSAAGVVADTGWQVATTAAAAAALKFVAQAGFTIISAKIRRSGNTAAVYVEGTIGSLSVPVNGNVANLALVKVPTGFETTQFQSLSTGSAGRTSAFHIAANSGLISLDATVADATATGTTTLTGEGVSFGGLYFI